MWSILLVAALAGACGAIYAQGKEIKKLRAFTDKLGTNLHELEQVVAQIEGLKPDERNAIEAVQRLLLRERFAAMAKDADAETLIS